MRTFEMNVFKGKVVFGHPEIIKYCFNLVLRALCAVTLGKKTAGEFGTVDNAIH